MAKLHLATLLLIAATGCATRSGPVLKDSGGWPYPTWARSSLVCFDPTAHAYVPARALHRDLGRQDVVCDFGRVNRGVEQDQTWSRQTAPAPSPTPSRAPSAPYPGGAGPTGMR